MAVVNPGVSSLVLRVLQHAAHLMAAEGTVVIHLELDELLAGSAAGRIALQQTLVRHLGPDKVARG